jgi:catechol 2,3-dioxygenase-like lactoylglutathione lyase family enzyme
MLQRAPLYAYLPAKDVARARDFYEGVLGFRPKEEFAGGVAYEFDSGTGAFLYPTENAGTSRASQAFWQVDDVEAEVAELARRGVALAHYDMPGERSPSGVVTAGGAKVAWFNDTEGNTLAIVQSTAPRTTMALRRLTNVLRPRHFGPTAVASAAIGALAIGTLAIGALAIGRLVVGRAAIRRLHIGELGIGRLRRLGDAR